MNVKMKIVGLVSLEKRIKNASILKRVMSAPVKMAFESIRMMRTDVWRIMSVDVGNTIVIKTQLARIQ